ncbi:triosephosphate isomerase [Desulfurobacterium thermolithotrophum DSM 11699]|uniref:Triosephosphate isomerase n=1 Tax=Desulfurobacterium thermolithotrophum (strain DSM 11699 / BSA) TaxID=868864 RepID=F0S313_DESTD|nr:triose-phosphate isomerase [Desulfurobacterium thermolithotrophum]ADY73235.1 triosephosphate isomerase [Desulfurobacterium thermolithotrophum DSM 11699]
MRRFLIAGNWKMHKTVSEAIELVRELKNLVKDVSDRDILICPPFTALYPVSKELEGSNITLGGQNMYFEEQGAFTGEISPLMLKSVGCSYVILGHSERRHIFGESDELINKKVLSSINHGLIPILCVGELLEERENGKTKEVVEEQIREGLKNVNKDAEFVIAYEPVWAIGTGKTATPELAEEVHLFIREVLSDMFGNEKASSVKILYGGSVKPENAAGLLKMENIDGALVGGASLKAESFAKIVKFDMEA